MDVSEIASDISSSYEFDAPKWVDFNNLDSSSEADLWFDTETFSTPPTTPMETRRSVRLAKINTPRHKPSNENVTPNALPLGDALGCRADRDFASPVNSLENTPTMTPATTAMIAAIASCTLNASPAPLTTTPQPARRKKQPQTPPVSIATTTATPELITPIMTRQLSTVTSITTHQSSTTTPITTHQSSTTTPITTHQSSTTTPITTHQSSTTTPITTHQSSTTTPITTHQSSTTSPITTHQSSTTTPILTRSASARATPQKEQASPLASTPTMTTRSQSARKLLTSQSTTLATPGLTPTQIVSEQETPQATPIVLPAGPLMRMKGAAKRKLLYAEAHTPVAVDGEPKLKRKRLTVPRTPDFVRRERDKKLAKAQQQQQQQHQSRQQMPVSRPNKTPKQAHPLKATAHSTFHRRAVATKAAAAAATTTPPYVFRARPVNRRIMESAGEYGVPRVPQRPTTVAHSPHFHYHPPTATNNAPSTVLSTAPTFKARPLNARIMESAGEYGVPRVAPRPLTVAHSPHFQYHPRSNPTTEAATSAAPKTTIHGRARPLTQPHSPALHTRQRARVFPQTSRASSRSTSAASSKTVCPFAVSAKETEVVRLRRLAREEEALRRKQEQSRQRPAAGRKTTTTTRAFGLHSDMRAQARAAYTQVHTEEQQRQEEQARAYATEQAQTERQRIAQLRRSQVHKAAPIRHYRPLFIQKATKPTTVPHSPHFTSKSKRKTEQ